MAGEAELIGAIGDLFYGKPKRLAVGVDADNNLIDANGNKTTFYAEPGKGAKFFSQNARRAAQVNEQFDTANIEHQLQQGQLRNDAGQLWDTEPEALKNEQMKWFAAPSNGLIGPTSPADAIKGARNYGIATILHDPLNPTAQLNRSKSGAILQNGLVGQQAALDANNAFAKSKLDANNIAFEGSMQDLSQANQRASAQLLSERLAKLDPMVQANAIAEAENIKGGKLTAAENYALNLKLINAQERLGLTQTANAQNIADIDAANAGLIGNIRGNELTGNYFKSRYGMSPLEYQQTPHVPVIVDGNIVLPSVNAPAHEGYINPTTEALNQAKELTGTGATPTITSSGSPYLKPPSTKPTIITPPRDYGNHELRIDAHNEGVKAQQEAAQADIKAKMAVLKAKQKQLEAEHTRAGILPVSGQMLQQLNDKTNPLALIGAATSNWHPIQRVNKILTGAGDVLIGQ